MDFDVAAVKIKQVIARNLNAKRSSYRIPTFDSLVQNRNIFANFQRPLSMFGPDNNEVRERDDVPSKPN